jgi:hypothetical protein
MPGITDQGIDEGEIEAAFPRFQQFPIDGGEDGVAVDLYKPGPEGPHILHVGGGRVAEFTPTEECG